MNSFSYSFNPAISLQGGKLSAAKLKLLQEAAEEEATSEEEAEREEEAKPISDVSIYEEETRMSADTNSSRAQTPAKQVTIVSCEGVIRRSASFLFCLSLVYRLWLVRAFEDIFLNRSIENPLIPFVN